jgi:SIR2-like domain
MLQFFQDPDTKRSLRSIAGARMLTVIVGAGASMEAGLPSWEALVNQLLEDGIEAQGWEQDGDWIKSYAKRNGLLTAAEIASTLLEREDLGSTVKHRLYADSDPRTLYPGPLTNAIAALQDARGRDMSVGTFNYDELIESALRSRTTTSWSTVRSYIQGRVPPRGTVAVTHLHGLLGREDKGRVILTEADYQIMQNSTSCWQEQWFVERLRASTCLFVGASMSDPNLIRYLHRAPRLGGPHFALLRRDSFGANDPEAPSLAARERSEAAERLRWEKLGVTVLFADNYADVAQFVWELGYLIENPTGYRSLPQRFRDWYRSEEANGCLFGRTEEGYATIQRSLHDGLREIRDDVRALLTTENARLADETLQMTLWALCLPESGSEQERVQSLAHTDRIMTAPETRETIELHATSPWTGVRCLCLGRPVDDPKDTYASRWKYVIGIPIFRESPRTPLGAVTLSTMTPANDTVLASLSQRATGTLASTVQAAAEPWLTLAR